MISADGHFAVPGSSLRVLPTQVAAHPEGRHTNVLGEPCHGPGIIQIWAVGGHGSVGRASGKGGDEAPARMALGVCHDGGVVWDLRWWPGQQQQQQQQQRQQQQRDDSAASSLPGCRPDRAC